jgi:hypothetical protein
MADLLSSESWLIVMLRFIGHSGANHELWSLERLFPVRRLLMGGAESRYCHEATPIVAMKPSRELGGALF